MKDKNRQVDEVVFIIDRKHFLLPFSWTLKSKLKIIANSWSKKWVEYKIEEILGSI